MDNTQKRKRKYQKINLTPHSRKQRRAKQKRDYDQSRVYIGDALEAWNDLKENEGLSDTQLAVLLINFWYVY